MVDGARRLALMHAYGHLLWGAHVWRAWREGEVLVLDDAFEHEVWNDSGEPRVILIVDVWHPDFSDAEVAWMAATREARHQRSGGGGATARG